MNSSSPTFIWRNIFEGKSTDIDWQHSGIDVLADGRLIYAAPNGSTLVIEDLASQSREFVETAVHEMHDVVAAGNGIWLCDIGHKYVLEGDSYVDRFTPARVVRIDTSGKILQELVQPNLPAFSEKSWSPTGLTVAPNGDIWIADGYSSYLVLRFNAQGEFLEYFTGEKTGLAFNCPHAIKCIDGDNGYEMVIADRANKRLVWMSPDGSIRRIVNHPALTSPSGITRYGNGLMVTQLYGSLVYVGDDDLVEDVISGQDIHGAPGWPNALNDAGRPVKPQFALGSVIAPHGITSNAKGEIFFTQWFIGGHVLEGSPKK